MSEPSLADHLLRAERALERIERAVAARAVAAPDTAHAPVGADTPLRRAVEEVVTELDRLIRQARAG